jgi:hypothetical protein
MGAFEGSDCIPTAEREAFAAVRTAGLSAGEAAAIEAFAADIRAGLDQATDADRRRLYDLLRIQGTVYDDPHGIKLGRSNRFRIEWTAAFPLTVSDTQLLKNVLLVTSRSEDSGFTLAAA